MTTLQVSGRFPAHFYVIVFQGLRLQASKCVTGFIAFSKVCDYSVRFRRIRVDESRIRNKMFAGTNESEYVWTKPV